MCVSLRAGAARDAESPRQRSAPVHLPAVSGGPAPCDETLLRSALAPVAAISPPPPDIQPVIDKLAEYVARNGLKFETSVRAKNDQR